ncbi:MAG: precorrin-6B methylase [Clostridium sp.]|nr:precorrin-6B methylase [Clostridium sp.]
MDQQMFSNSSILSWLTYYAEKTPVDLGRIKILDITRKNKNVIPTVESHNSTLIFTEAGHQDIFYRMWNAGLGDCTVWYNEGSDPSGEILNKPVKEMINRGINASAAMLIINPNARSTSKIGMNNMNFRRGSVRYVGSEIRAVMLSKMHVDQSDTICVISGESIAVEAALQAPEGTVIAVEYNQKDRRTLEDNAHDFGLHNIDIIDHVDDETLKDLPAPRLTMLVASASMEQEIECLLRKNPDMEFMVYTLDFQCAASMPAVFERFGITDTEILQIEVSKLNSKREFVSEPAPWIITGKRL